MEKPNYISFLLSEISRNDSESAFEQLYLLYYDKLISYSLTYLHAECDAEEIVSDVMLYIWKDRKHLETIDNFNAYIYRIVRNKSISRYRQKDFSITSIDDINTDIFQTIITPETLLISEENVNKINAEINKLPTKCKEAFKLVKEQRLKYKEVADILQISVKTLESHLTLAMHRLRQNINRK